MAPAETDRFPPGPFHWITKSLSLQHGLDLQPVEAEEEGHTQGGGEQLRQGEGPPHQVQLPAEGQQPRRRQQHHQLADHGDHQTQHTVAQGLEGGGAHNAEARQQEAEADDPQGRHADGQHMLRGVKKPQEHRRAALEDPQAKGHNGRGVDHRQLHRLGHPLGFLGPVVIGHNGHQAIVQAEDRHEDEALKLEVHPQHRRSRGGKGDEDLVHTEDHYRADGGHDDGGHAHPVDAADGGQMGTEAPQMHSDLVVLPAVEPHGQHRAHDLAQNGGHRRAQNTHVQHKDEHRVQYNVGQGPGGLGDHGVHRLSCGLQQPLISDGQKQAQGTHGTAKNVGRPLLHNLHDIGLGQEECPGAENADNRKDQIAAHRQKNAVGRRQIHPLLVLLPQTLAQQGIDTHAGTGGHGDHQVLNREGQADGVEGVLTEPGHEHAVHHVVQGLDQHGDHDGQRHAQQQPVHRQHTHFVLPCTAVSLNSLFHRTPLPGKSPFLFCFLGISPNLFKKSAAYKASGRFASCTL